MNREFEFPAKGEYVLDRIFLDFRHPRNDVGWKLHVVKPSTLSVDNPYLPKNYLDLLRFLYVKKIPHKIVRNLNGIAAMERTATQVGKFITIYPDNTEQLKRVPELIDALIPDNSPGNGLAPGDLPVSARGLASARWGGLTSPFSMDRNGNLVLDDRNAGAYPDWVRNPFDPASGGADGWVQFDDDAKAEVRRQMQAMFAPKRRR